MNKNLHNIDGLFKKALGQHEEEPSAKVWDNIDKNLDKKKVASILKKYKKLQWAAAILLIFLAGMAMYILKMEKNNKELVNKNTIEKGEKKNDLHLYKTLSDSIYRNESDTVVIHKNKNLKDSKKENPDSLLAQNNKPLLKRSIIKNPQKFKATSNLNNAVTFQNNLSVKYKTAADNVFRHKITIVTAAITTKNQIGKVNVTTENNDIVDLSQRNNDHSVNNKQPLQIQYNNKDNLVEHAAALPVPLLSVPIDYSRLSTLSLYNPFEILYSSALNRLVNIYDGNNFKQNNTTKNVSTKASKANPFSLTVFYSPEIINNKIESDHPRFREDNRNEIEKNERVKLASNFGILIGYNFSNNWWLQSGVSLFTKVINIQSKNIYARPDENGTVDFRLSCSSGSSYIPLKSGAHPVQGDSTRVSADNTMQYLNFPLLLKYAFSKNKFSIYPGAGIAINVLTKSTIETELSAFNEKENTINNIEGVKSTYFNSSLSLGAAYQLNKKMSVNIEPTLRVALSPINKNTPVQTRLNTIGFATGLTIKL